MNRRNLYREEAIPLVMLDPETKRYTINNEALEMISQLPSPIGVTHHFQNLRSLELQACTEQENLIS